MSIKVDSLLKENANLKIQVVQTEDVLALSLAKVEDLKKELPAFKARMIKWPFGFYRLKADV